MAQHRVLARSYIDSIIREPGEVIEYSGPPAEHLEPLEPVQPVRLAATLTRPPETTDDLV